MSHWTFLTNHAHVMLLLSRNPDLRIRDLASRIGITQRAVHRIVAELTDEGYLLVEKQGRRNHYEVVRGAPLRHPVEAGACIHDLIDVLGQAGATPVLPERDEA